MGKHFLKVKRKTRLAALVTAVITGVAIGLISAAAIMLFSKLSAKSIDSLYYLCSAGLAVAASALLFFAFMPSSKRLAKRIDEENRLDERMRTMLAFEGREDMFSVLQREDAEEKLSVAKVKFWRKKQVISAIVTLAVSIGCVTGAILVPAKAEEGEKPLDEFDKQWLLADLSDIISLVESSMMDEQLRDITLAELNGLVDFVSGHDMMSEIKAEAITVVIDVNTGLKRTNTAVGIGNALTDSANPALATLAEGLASLSGNTVRKGLESLYEIITSDDELIEASAASDELLYAMTDIDTSSAVTRILKNLVSAMRNYSDGGEVDIDDAFNVAKSQLSPEIMLQILNKTTIQTVTTRLCSLFGIVQSDLNTETDDPIIINPPRDDEGTDETPDINDDDNQDIGSGGIGTGELIYGSNDMLYDYRTNTYVPFGQLLADYRAKANEKVNDGKLEEDFAAFVKAYFQKISESKSED